MPVTSTRTKRSSPVVGEGKCRCTYENVHDGTGDLYETIVNRDPHCYYHGVPTPKLNGREQLFGLDTVGYTRSRPAAYMPVTETK